MGSFRYRVKGKSGQELSGQMDAEDRQVAAARLRDMGYFVMEVAEVHERQPIVWNPFSLLVRWMYNPIFGGASTYQLAVFYRQFATMVKSGMSLGHAMSSLSSQGGCRCLRRVARETMPFLHSGGSVSDGFARYPWVFPRLHISLLKAAESGGTMDRMLERIADYLEREHGIRQRLRLATLYPKILILALIFIPKLPVLVLGTAEAYLKATMGQLVYVLAVVGIIWVGFRLLVQIPGVTYGLDLLKLSIPVVGKTVRMLALTKFYRVLSSMYAAGTPISQSIMHAADATANGYLASRLKTAVPGLQHGAQLSETLRYTRVMPQMALDMVMTGEQTGNVDGMLDKAAEYTENEAEVSIVQMTVILGVLLLLAVGLQIALFVITFYVKQYSGMVNQ